MSEPRKVSFLGLGVMGGAIARHIGEAGHELTVYNRSPARVESWVAANPGLTARVAASPADAAEGADMVITCVGNDDDLAEVVLGPQGVFRSLRQAGVFVDHTTVSAQIARQIAVEARDKQVRCVDAPMTGSQIGAEKGTLTLMCGGRPDAIEAARRSRGRWTTAGRPWATTNSISASPSTGCARTWASPWTKAGAWGCRCR